MKQIIFGLALIAFGLSAWAYCLHRVPNAVHGTSFGESLEYQLTATDNRAYAKVPR